MADSGNTVAPVPSGPDEDNNTNNTNNPDDSESIAILTTRLTSDHHLIATLSISGIMGADVAVFPNTTGPNATGSDEVTSTGGNIYTVSIPLIPLTLAVVLLLLVLQQFLQSALPVQPLLTMLISPTHFYLILKMKKALSSP